MSARRKVEWLLLAATAIMLIVLKWLHLGVTHYNIFLLILLAWCLGLILIFRLLAVYSHPDD